MSTSIYFILLVVHTHYYNQHFNQREGGGRSRPVNLFTCFHFHFPTLPVSCTQFVFLGSVEYIVSCHCFGIETVGKEKIYIIIFHFWRKRKKNSVLELYRFLSIYLSCLYVSMSVFLSMPVCLVLFVFV